MTITKETPTEVWVKTEKRELKFWKLGIGLIPIHKNPKLAEDFEVRIYLKCRQRKEEPW